MASVLLLGIKDCPWPLQVTAATVAYVVRTINGTIVKNNTTHDFGCGSSIC